jgi:hypothetical protein
VIQATSGPVTPVERIGLVAGLVLALLLMWPIRGYVTDDTYIHLQYAKHLAQGDGLVFNVGERVYGCTSPLWAALLADGMMLGFDGLATARALGVTATLASVVLFLMLTRRTMRVPELRALATVGWAGHAWMLRWSTSGMETPLAVALTLAGFVTFTEGRLWGSRPVRTGALWALAALTRPEMVFLLALWGVLMVVETDNRNALRRLVFGTLPPLAIYGSWLLFSRLYFGTFWPQTLSAKAAGSESLEFHIGNLVRQLKVVGATDGVLGLTLLAALVFGGPRMFPRSHAQRLLPWLWVIGVPLLYLARGVPVLSRYLLPLLPVLAWLAWRAAERWWVGETPTPASTRRAVLLGWLLASFVLAQNLTVFRASVVPHVVSFSAGLEDSLVRWGRWFGRHTTPGTVIAAPDIGAIGYFSDRHVLDLAGLVTPEIVPLLRHEVPENVVANLRFSSFSRPEFLIDRASVANDLLARSPYSAALTPLGDASVPNLGLARPGQAVYTFYRVDWAAFDSLEARRRHPSSSPR